MPATYEPIATTTLGSNTSSITFSSIPGTYTDLRVIVSGTATSGEIRFRFNGSTSAIYSRSWMIGDGSITGSSYEINVSYIQLSAGSAYFTSTQSMAIADIFSYTSNNNKSSLFGLYTDRNGAGGLTQTVGLWRNTAAITSVTILMDTTFLTGTTATLYGILKA